MSYLWIFLIIIIIVIIIIVINYVVMPKVYNKALSGTLQSLNSDLKEKKNFINMYKGIFGELPNNSKIKYNIKTSIAKYTPSITNLEDISKKYNSLPLQQFCIKGSFNSALFTYTNVSGTITIDNIMYVLTQGCRVLDFELYYLADPITSIPDAYVGYNPFDDAILPSSDNIIPFRDVMRFVSDYGLSRQYWKSDIYGNDLICPNPKDPLFIQIRFKTHSSYKSSLYKLVNDIFNSGYSNSIYLTNKQEIINSNTIIEKLAGKIVILFPYDIEFANNNELMYNNLFPCISPNNFNFASIIVNNDSLNKVYYSNIDLTKYKTTPLKASVEFTVDSTSWNIVYPDSINNVESGMDEFNNCKNFLIGINDYGYQIYMLQYYNWAQQAKYQLDRIERMFNTYRTAFVPMRVALDYIDPLKDVEPSSYT